MSDLREALARLLRDAEVAATTEALMWCTCVGILRPLDEPHKDGCPMREVAQRVRERQAAVMEAVVGWYASEPSKYDTIDGRLRMALAAGQAHLQEKPDAL